MSLRSPLHARLAFTLAELLVAMAIIAVLAAVTVVSVGGIAKDARLATGKNAVVAALDSARTQALGGNKIVLVAFRARLDGTEQVIEAVTAEWTGESYCVPTLYGPASCIVDRFAPIPDVPARALPRGIKIAAPQYGVKVAGGGVGVDHHWLTPSELLAIERASEMSGVVVAVMYSPDGTVITENSQSNASLIMVDFNNDGLQRQGGTDYDNVPPAGQWDRLPTRTAYCDLGYGFDPFDYFCQAQEDDEPFVMMAPFIAVYDDEEAREISDTTGWSDGQTRIIELTAIITERADRVHFNRYTGVALK